MHYFVGQIYIFHTLLNEKHSVLKCFWCRATFVADKSCGCIPLHFWALVLWHESLAIWMEYSTVTSRPNKQNLRNWVTLEAYLTFWAFLATDYLKTGQHPAQVTWLFQSVWTDSRWNMENGTESNTVIEHSVERLQDLDCNFSIKNFPENFNSSIANTTKLPPFMLS